MDIPSIGIPGIDIAGIDIAGIGILAPRRMVFVCAAPVIKAIHARRGRAWIDAPAIRGACYFALRFSAETLPFRPVTSSYSTA